MEHPPYVHEISPSDLHLFVSTKQQLNGERFTSDTDVTQAVRF
jgi:hypothetical protein